MDRLEGELGLGDWRQAEKAISAMSHPRASSKPGGAWQRGGAQRPHLVSENPSSTIAQLVYLGGRKVCAFQRLLDWPSAVPREASGF